MSQSKRIKLTSEEAFRFDVDHISIHVGEIPAHLPPPGVVRYIDDDAVLQAISRVLQYPLYPVILQATSTYNSLVDALSDSAIPDNGKAIIQLSTYRSGILFLRHIYGSLGRFSLWCQT